MSRKTFYMRVLPEPPAVAFSSPTGKQLFAEALAAGTMEGFFKLVQQFRTQDEPAFCGLAAVAMTLNALQIDPRRAWKGPWRWFNESMLDCCLPLDTVAKQGITLAQAACLARCNGAAVEVYHADTSLEAFRSHVADCASTGSCHVVVSYSRKQMLQTGDGHFSPLGGFHEEGDMALLLDTARFKYPPHWVPLTTLYEAMFDRLDPATGKPRGYMVIAARPVAESVLLTLDRRISGWEKIHQWLQEGPQRCIAQSGVDTSARQLMSQIVLNAPIDKVAAFVAVRDSQSPTGCEVASDQSSVCEDKEAISSMVQAAMVGCCSIPQAVQTLLEELESLPLFSLMAAAAGCDTTGIPMLAARLVFLLLLVPSAAWTDIPDTEVRRGVMQLLDMSGSTIIAAEAAYLAHQYRQIAVLEGEESPVCNAER